MKITFRKQIHACFASVSSDDVWLERVHNFPFLPFEGMEVGDEEVVQTCVDWDGGVTCYVEPDKTFYDLGRNEGLGRVYRETPEFEDLIQLYINDGWSREAQKDNAR